MNILITGHKGYIGSHLWKRLESKHTLYGIDIKDGNDILTCSFDYDVDLVIHLAGKSGVRESINDPASYWMNNVEGTKRIFEAFKFTKILYASSSSAYEPWLNPYAASKLVIDRTCPENAVGMRFHTVYSDTPRKGMFFDKLFNGELKYTTSHTRDFVHIDDLCDAIEILMNSQIHGIVDIGSGEAVTVSDLAPTLPVLSGKKTERADTLANLELLKVLGYKPKYNVKKYLTNKGLDVKL